MLTRKEADEIKYQLLDLADKYIRATHSTAPCMQLQAQIRASNLYAAYETVKPLLTATFNSGIIPSIITDALIVRAQIDANKLFSDTPVACDTCDKFNGCQKDQKYKFLGMDQPNPDTASEVTHG